VVVAVLVAPVLVAPVLVVVEAELVVVMAGVEVVVVGGMQGTIVVDDVVVASLGPHTVGLFSPNRVLYTCSTAGAAISAP
jgi:hypothetical protein